MRIWTCRLRYPARSNCAYPLIWSSVYNARRYQPCQDSVTAFRRRFQVIEKIPCVLLLFLLPSIFYPDTQCYTQLYVPQPLYNLALSVMQSLQLECFEIGMRKSWTRMLMLLLVRLWDSIFTSSKRRVRQQVLRQSTSTRPRLCCHTPHSDNCRLANHSYPSERNIRSNHLCAICESSATRETMLLIAGFSASLYQDGGVL